MVYHDNQDIVDLFALDNKYRVENAEGDLILLSDFTSSNVVNKYNFCVLAPFNWNVHKYTHIDQNSYDKIFKNICPLSYSLLQNIDNVVVAGGSALMPLLNKQIVNKFSDIDVFIYGISDDKQFMDKVTEISNYIKEYILNVNNLTSSEITEKIKCGLVSIKISFYYEQEIQIILRKYHSISSLIHSFDIPSCCIAYDGKNTYLTSLSKYAIINQINLVNMKHKSTTYEIRLLKYFSRNFAIGLPGYILPSISYNNELELKYFKISVINIEENIITGFLSIQNIQYMDKSYSKFLKVNENFDNCIEFIECLEQYGFIMEYYIEQNKNIDYSNFLTDTVNDLINKFGLELDILLNKIINKLLKAKLHKLIYQKIPKHILIQLFPLILDNNQNEIKKILFDIIKSHGNYIPKWILSHDPSKPYSSIIYPIEENINTWYYG
jgi:hypothetical protein